MNGYSIYCTPEQTKKAFELGVPINTIGCTRGEIPLLDDYVELVVMDDNTSIISEIPTAEQMIGWLKEQEITIHIFPFAEDKTFVWIIRFSCEGIKRNMCSDIYNSRKEATLAAIDAVLKYLTNNKK